MPKHFALFSILPILLTANAHAQTQNTSPEPTIWDHNGSVMYLVANGSSREFYYRKPRPGMLEAGARAGSLLFRGQVKDGEYVGTAYLFNPRCGQIPFQVKGPILDNDERVVLTGQTPYVGRNCQTYGSFTSNLEFRLLKPIEASQSQGPLATAQSPGVEEPQPEPRDTAEIKQPDAPAGQASRTSGTPKDPSRSNAEPKPPITATAKSPVTNEPMLAAKDLSGLIAEPEPPSTPIKHPSVTNESPSEADNLEIYVLAAMLVVMIGSIIGFAVGMFSEKFWRKKTR